MKAAVPDPAVATMRELAELSKFFQPFNGPQQLIVGVYMSYFEVEDPEGQRGDVLRVFYKDIDHAEGRDEFFGLIQLGRPAKPQALLITGNIVDGMEFIGPFEDEEAAVEYAEGPLNTDTNNQWNTAVLQPQVQPEE